MLAIGIWLLYSFFFRQSSGRDAYMLYKKHVIMLLACNYTAIESLLKRVFAILKQQIIIYRFTSNSMECDDHISSTLLSFAFRVVHFNVCKYHCNRYEN